jgi:hypothetical protein
LASKPSEQGGKMKVESVGFLKKAIKDNELKLGVARRGSGVVKVAGNAEDIATLNELLNGLGYELKQDYHHGYYTLHGRR